MTTPRSARETESNDGARVLVTGGAGFIGSHVVDALLQHDVPVTVIDDLSNGVRANLPDDPRLRFLEGDVTDPAAVSEALVGCSRIIHLAAVASVQRSVEDPVGTHRVNYEATLRLLESARQRNVTRVVYASSAAVYGDAQEPPVDELGPLDPQTPYAVDKLMGEKALGFYGRAHGIEGVSLRLFNVFGPRQRDDSPYSGVVSLFVRRLHERAPITVYGDGHQTRDFVFVGDVARVILELALAGAAPSAQVLNVGRGEAVTVLGLIHAIERAFGASLDRRFAPGRPGEVRRSCAAVTRLRGALGWTPATPLEHALGHFGGLDGEHGTTHTRGTDAPWERLHGD